jgi:hypothetical protein
MKPKSVSHLGGKKPLVKFYSGYKGLETPRSVMIGKKEHKIIKIKDRKRILDHESGKQFDQFICKTEDKTYLITVPESGKSYKVEVYKEKGKQKHVGSIKVF